MVKNREYISSIDQYNKPTVLNGDASIGFRLMELIMMNPGDNPLHPEMGVGLRDYRYGINTLTDLEQRIYDQIDTYLPMYRIANINLKLNDEKILSVEISIDDTTYVYDTADTANPITLDQIEQY
jgi:hypothetical protein